MPVRNAAQSSFSGKSRPVPCARQGGMRVSCVLILGMTEPDAIAIAMLATILLSFGVVGMLFACMARNASRRDADVDRLLEELEHDEKSAKQVKAGSVRGERASLGRRTGIGGRGSEGRVGNRGEAKMDGL